MGAPAVDLSQALTRAFSPPSKVIKGHHLSAAALKIRPRPVPAAGPSARRSDTSELARVLCVLWPLTLDY